MSEKKVEYQTEGEYWVDIVQIEANRWHEKYKTYSFSRIPNALFEYSGVLGLSTSELGFLCMLLHHMRYKKSSSDRSRIYPSLSRLSDYKIATSRVTLSKLASILEEKGLIKIVRDKGESNTYDPSGLFAILVHLVEKDEEIKNRIEFEKDNGGIKDRREADDYRFKELKVQLGLRKRQLGLT